MYDTLEADNNTWIAALKVGLVPVGFSSTEMFNMDFVAITDVP